MSQPAELEEPRKGRSNAILTYETVAEIQMGIQRLDLKITRLDEKLDDVGREHDDHELRIRVLERVIASSDGSTALTRWILPIMVSLASLGLAAVAYLK